MTDNRDAVATPAPSIPDADEATTEMLLGARRHIALIATDGVWWSTQKVGAAVESVDDLAEFLDKLFQYQYLKPLGEWVPTERGRKRFVGEQPQVWILGPEMLKRLGWDMRSKKRKGETRAEQRQRIKTELIDQIRATLDPILADGWEVMGDQPGYFIKLKRDLADGTWYRINLVLEPLAWMAQLDDTRKEHGICGVEGEDTELPLDDTEARIELTRRLAWSIHHLGILPAPTSSGTGANLQDIITARKKVRDDVIDQPTMLPELRGMRGGVTVEPEPKVTWALNYLPPEMINLRGREAHGLTEIDQKMSYGTSAGNVTVGYGEKLYLEHDEAAEFVMLTKNAKGAWVDRKNAPYGMFEITLPAGRKLVATKGIPDATYRGEEDAGTGYLPWPHPLMRADEEVTTWVTAPTLDILREPVANGGAGLTLDELQLTSCHVWEQETIMLRGFQALLAKAAKAAVLEDDKALEQYVKAIPRAYIGRMKDPDQWRYDNTRHHHQPILRSAIQAHARNRGRRWAAKLGYEYGHWPIYSDTDSWVYTFRDDFLDVDPPWSAAPEILWGEQFGTRSNFPEPMRSSTRGGAFVARRQVYFDDVPLDRFSDLLAADDTVKLGEAVLAILKRRPSKEADDGEGES